VVSELESKFHQAMLDIYRRALSEAAYNASYFLQMVERHGGVEAARQLVTSAAPATGFVHLWERNRLDLTVEALVTDNEQWHPLFSRDELRQTKARLCEYHYFG
jgi:hypothetical protein